MSGPNATAIRRVRAPRQLIERPALRRALAAFAEDRAPSRYGFPPKAIVMVRRLRMHWRELARGDDDRELAALLTSARRPAHGELSGDAVWFADEAELLACLALDTMSGSLSLRWWWRTHLRGSPSQRVAIARWLASPRSVPRALAQQHEPAAWFACWQPRELRALVAALQQSYPVSEVVARWVHNGELSTGPQSLATNAVRVRSSTLTPVAPLPSIAARLSALCLALARDPVTALAPDHIERTLCQLDTPGVEPPTPQTAFKHTSPRRRESLHAEHEARAPVHSVNEASRAHSVHPLFPRSSTHCEDQPAEHAQAAHRAPSVAARPLRQEATLDARSSFSTAHGGLFFLLNAALALGLYGDFSQPLQAGLACSPWRFLLRAGQRWLRGFRADPLAAWLRRAQGQTFPSVAPVGASWRLPPAWLAPFASQRGTWHAHWRSGWLCLRHPAGFAVLEQRASSADCDALVAAELTRLALSGPVSVQRTIGQRAQPRRRVRRQCPDPLWRYLRARVTRALGQDDTPDSLLVMLELPARCSYEDDRLDVQFELAALPLSVRLAGLDRDPGFIPAAGADVRFHFH